MPLRPVLLDLREYPLCERPMRVLLSLERLAMGETMVVIDDCDPDPLLKELKPALDRGYTYWVAEEGPEIWRIFISCEELIDKPQAGV